MTTNRWKGRIKISIVICILILFGIYGYIQAQNLIKGPIIKVEYPEEYQKIEDNIFTVKGKVKNVSKINLNGSPIFITPQGEFKEKLPIIGRHTIIEIEAWDRFDRSTKIHRSVTSDSVFSKELSQEYIKSRREGTTYRSDFLPIEDIEYLEIYNQ